jgi:hypothetical protein
MKDTRLLLVGLLGLAVLGIVLFKVTVRRPAAALRPVASSSGVPSSSVSRTDANGVTWGLDQAGGGLVATEPNGPQPGAPIVVKTDVQRVGQRAVSIGLVLEGQAGEPYRPVIKRNGTPVSAPGLRIVNETGQVLAQDSFQYG